MRLGEILHAGGETVHQRLHPGKPLPGRLQLRGGERGVDFFCLDRLVPLQVAEPLVDIVSRSGQPDIARGNLHLPQLDLRDQRAVDHPLGSRDAAVGGLDRRLGHHLVGHHAGGQQDADGAGEAELVADAIELDHFANPDPQRKSVVPCLCPTRPERFWAT